MKLHIVSDLHTDSHSETLTAPPADLSILAGDFADGGHMARHGYAGFKASQPVLAIFGNHEFHGLDIDRDRPAICNWAANAGIRLLDCEVAEQAGWRILGCCLWTDFSLSGDAEATAQAMQPRLSDFSAIRCGERSLTPGDVIGRHRRERDWLAAELARGDPARSIVITHFGVTPKSIHPKYDLPGPRSLNPYFATDLTALIRRFQPPLWIHGHTHIPLDYRVGRTRVLCNPRGRGSEAAPGYRPDLVLELD